MHSAHCVVIVLNMIMIFKQSITTIKGDQGLCCDCLSVRFCRVGPSVRKLIEEYHVNINEIKGSGPQNRLTKG